MTRYDKDLLKAIIFGILLLLAMILGALSAGCPATSYGRYFANVTNYKVDKAKMQYTPSGIRYQAPAGIDVRAQVDAKVAAFEACMGLKVRRDWIGVLIPTDAYVSKCSGQWLVPSTPNCQLCISQKGLPLPKECCGLRLPTAACPCVCSMRSVVQDGWLIVTTKTLALFVAELARVVTGVSFPWGNPGIAKCIKE